MKRNLLALVTLATLAIPAVSQAAPPHPGPYVSGFLGVSVPRDTDVTTDDYVNAQTFNDRVAFDPGVYVGGTAGYDFGFLRLEGELSYRYSEMKSITDQADGFQFQSPDGNLGVLAVMGNAFFDFHNPSPITPYWGGGIGFAALHLSDTYGIDTRSGSGQDLLLYPEDDATAFAYQAGAGVEVALNRQLSLDIGYRYFGTANARFDSDRSLPTELKFESHNAMVGLRVKF